MWYKEQEVETFTWRTRLPTDRQKRRACLHLQSRERTNLEQGDFCSGCGCLFWRPKHCYISPLQTRGASLSLCHEQD